LPHCAHEKWWSISLLLVGGVAIYVLI